MQISKKQWITGGVGLVVTVLAVIGWSGRVQSPAPAAPSVAVPVAATATSTGEAIKEGSVSAVQPFPMNAADTLISWSFKGAYTGNDTLIKQTNADIALLTGLLGKGKYDDYDLYNGIGNDYAMLGDGQRAYQNFNRSIGIHPTKGLAFVNLAHLMDQLAAYHTAADAYAKAVMAEPRMLEYHIDRLTFLTRQFSGDNVLVTAAFTDASKQFGDTAPILAIEAEWLSAEHRYADAIKAWETVKALTFGKDTSAIDAAIERLKAKQ